MAGLVHRFITLFFITALSCFSTGAFGYTCAQLFPDGVSNHLDAGIIKIASNSRIRLGPDGIVATKSLADNSGGTSCDTKPCTATPDLPPAQSYSNFPGGTAVKVGYRQSLTLAPGHYGGLSTGGESILTLTSGEYSFAGSFVIGSAAQIKVPTGAKVAVYASDYINFQGAALINSPSTDSSLLFYTNTYMNISSDVKLNALLYASSYVAIANPGDISGAISAGGTVNLNSVTYVTYEASRVANASFPSFCSASGPASLEVQPATTAASTCAPVSITVSALKADGSLMTDYEGTFALSTSTGRGDWSKTGVAADAYGTLTPGGANSGSASYTFAADGSDGGNAVLHLANSHAETLYITASDVTAGINASATISFSANAYVVDSLDSLGSDVVAGRPHAWRIRMMRQDATTGVCSVARGYTATQVSAWLTRGAQDPGGAAPQVRSASTTISLPETAPAAANFALAFSAGVATFDLLTSDVGQYALAFADNSLAFSDQAISGSSQTITASPFGLYLNVPGNPAAADALGAAFQAAGRLSASNHRFAWLQGRGSVQTDLVLQRAAVPDGPVGQLETGVRLQDADGIGFAPADLSLDSDINGSNDKISLGQTEVRFGRLRLDPSFGPETADLPVVLLTEYWDGAAWRTNQDDSCTMLALSAVTYPSGAINISANRSVSVGGGTSTGTYPFMTSTDIGFANGNARHYFTAPGAGNTGTFAVNTNLSAYPWLWFDWNGDGSYSDSTLPAANYTFGAYRGHDRVLYWQEVMN